MTISLPITFTKGLINVAERRLRVAAMQVLIVDERKNELPAQRLRSERETIKGLRAQHGVEAVFFCECSHYEIEDAREAFSEEADRSDIFIGFGDRTPSDLSRYSVVGPERFFWYQEERVGLTTIERELAVSFRIKGIRIKLQICGEIGAGRELLQLRLTRSDIDLVLNPSITNDCMMLDGHAGAGGGFLPRAYLGVNNGVYYKGRHEGGRSLYVSYNSLGSIERESITQLGMEPGVLIADIPIPAKP
jgi:hypothetical protein